MSGAFLAYLCYIVEVAIFNYIFYKRFKSVINPMSALSIPFTLIVIICLLFNETLGFVSFYYEAIWIWTIGLFLFFWGGILVDIIGSSLIRNKYYNKYSGTYIFHIIIFICICIAIVKFRSVISYNDFGSKEMGAEMGMGGIVGRVSNVLLIAFPYYVVRNIKLWIKFPLAICLLIFIFALGSKTWIMYSILAAFITYVLLNRNYRINYKVLLVALCVMLLSFVLYYKLKVSIGDSDKFIAFVARHFYFYITSGVLPLSEYVKLGMDSMHNGITLPFISIIYYWMGEAISVHSPLWIVTDNVLGISSNVYTFFGTLWILGDRWDYVIYSILSGIISMTVYKVYVTHNNIFSLVAYAYTLCILFFGWYNWFFGALRIWEMYVLCFIFERLIKKGK